MSAIKFYADEHVRNQIITSLKGNGIDVISTDEAGNKGKLDIEQPNFAISDKRVILTGDPDYLVISTNRNHCGIFFISGIKPDNEIVRKILAMMEILESEDTMGLVIYI